MPIKINTTQKQLIKTTILDTNTENNIPFKGYQKILVLKRRRRQYVHDFNNKPEPSVLNSYYI